MTGFRKRYYSSWKSFWQDLTYLLSHRDEIKAAMHSKIISEAFRERLMLAVTEVNGCRYCRTFHIQQAYQAGLSADEIKSLVDGITPEDTPEEQKLAICYAKSWAESDTYPEEELQNQIRDQYGEKGYRAIQMVLRMIRMGNLLGNTSDYLLYRISFGRWSKG